MLFDLLTPWLTFLAILIPLLALERWIHQHLYGVGWLLTQDKERATILYYLILLPGVFLHEITQWATAGALKAKTSKIKVWPRPQTNGTLRFDFVKINKKTEHYKITMFNLAPLLAGIGVVLFISRNIFDVQQIPEAFKTGNLEIVYMAVQQLLGTPDFWLWLYLLFAVSNAMIPPPSEREDWPIIAAILAVVTVILGIMGLAESVIIPTLQGPINRILSILAIAFSTILVVDVFAVLLLGSTEMLLEKVTGRHAKYPKPKKTRTPKPEPGGELPMPEDQAPLRIEERRLPVPPPPKKQPKKKALPAPTTDDRSLTPTYSPTTTSATASYTARQSATPQQEDREEQPARTSTAAFSTGTRAYTTTAPDDDTDALDSLRNEVTATGDDGEDEVLSSYSVDTDKDDLDDGIDDDDELRYEAFDDAP